jgi:pSer/pThr/pTyr-binding forkhead associated (FHA) protein
MDRQPMLVATRGPLEGARFPVSADGVTLGRDPECTVVLDDGNVSRFHARLVFHNASIWVQDVGSRNGVFLNEKRVVRHKQFGPGDELVIGEHVFTLEMELLEAEPSLTGSIPAIKAPLNMRLMMAVAVGIMCLLVGLVVLLQGTA